MCLYILIISVVLLFNDCRELGKCKLYKIKKEKRILFMKF